MLLGKSRSRLLSPSSGATWAGGWRRTQRQSRIPIGLFFYCSRMVFYCPRIVFNFPRMVFLLSENCFTIFVIVLSRFALNDAGRSMVAALVARILEDPQLGDEQINLSWTTTVGEVRVDLPNAQALGGVFHKCLILSHGTRDFFPIQKGLYNFEPKVFHDTGVFNVNPAYYNSTLLDLLVFNGRCMKHSFEMWKPMVF